MAIAVSCNCGKSYNLKEEYAGQTVQCPTCGGAIEVGASGAASDPVFGRDKFLLHQKHLSISEKYKVWDEQGNVLLFVERPAHVLRNLLALFAGVLSGAVVAAVFGALASAVSNEGAQAALILAAILGFIVTLLVVGIALSQKRHTHFYSDETRSRQLMEIKQDQKFSLLNATYTLVDAQEQVIARFRKNYLYNIFRKRWYCTRPDGATLCVAMEDSLILSLLRRVLGPLFGILRVNFIILEGTSENVIGEFNRKFTLLDRYVLDLTADRGRALDRRIALALGVLLDTGERR